MTLKSKSRLIQVLLGAVVGLATVAIWFGARTLHGGAPDFPSEHFLSQPIRAPSFTLTSQDGHPVSSGDFRGKILVVFFGYTSCPDVCPLTLTKLTRAFREMDEDGRRIQVLLITVDPARDTPERLQRYLTNFHPSFLGLSGTVEEIRSVAEGFGAYFSDPIGEGDYSVDHTARAFVVDSDGRIPLSFPVSATAEEMARDLTTLLERSGNTTSPPREVP